MLRYTPLLTLRHGVEEPKPNGSPPLRELEGASLKVVIASGLTSSHLEQRS